MFGKKKEPQEITISNKTLARIILFFGGAILFVLFIDSIRHPLTLVLVSAFLALALNPAVAAVAKRLKKQNRTRATGIAYLSVVTILVAFVALVVPPLVTQTRDFVDDIPNTINELQEDEGFIGNLIRENNLEEQVTELADEWSQDIANFQPVVSTAGRIIANIISVVLVLVLTFMMLIEGPRWLNFFWNQIPDENNRTHAKKLANKMYKVVTSYVNGQLLIAALGAAFASIGFFIATAIFDVNASINPLAVGGIVFIFNLIPSIGVFISSMLVVLFSLFVSIPLALTMIVFFIIYQQLENTTIQPYIQAKGLDLTPMTVLIAAIIGLGFAGILGALVAIPTVGILKVLLDDYLMRRKTKTAEDKKS